MAANCNRVTGSGERHSKSHDVLQRLACCELLDLVQGSEASVVAACLVAGQGKLLRGPDPTRPLSQFFFLLCLASGPKKKQFRGDALQTVAALIVVMLIEGSKVRR